MATTKRNSDAFQGDEFGDFIIRRRILPVWQLLVLFFLSFTILFLVTTNADMLGGKFGLGLAIFAIIGPLTWFTVYFSQQNRDMLLAAEFQNALFSAAARLKSKFVIIVKQDGTIFYYDRGFQSVFPETGSHGTLMIDKLFSSNQISTVEAEKLHRALEEQRTETVFIHLPDGKGQEQKIIITIDPLPRPTGFYILRGRDYVAKRYEKNALRSGPAVPLTDNPHASITLEHMLHSLPYGVYTTDAEGNLQFVNYTFEEWLGYNQSEMVLNKLALADILQAQNTEMADNILLRDSHGDIQFKNKDGRAVQLHLQQQITKDSHGAVIGSVGILQPEKYSLRTENGAKPVSPHAVLREDTLQAAPSLVPQIKKI